MDPILTFKNKSFYLNKSFRSEPKPLPLIDAAKFRRYADEKAEGIFRRNLNTMYVVPTLPYLPFLDAHQREGIQWILSRSRSYLAHAPGAGKTAQAIIASIVCCEKGQTLFIVPPGLTVNWVREIEKFGNEPFERWFSTTIIPTTDRKEEVNWKADFIICPDSMLTKDWVYEALSNINFKFLAVDEASRFKDPQSSRSLALYGGQGKDKAFKGLIRGPHHVVLMDGSPMPNGRPMELWAPLFALTPETIDFWDQEAFGFKYCGPRQDERGHWTFNHSCNEGEFKEKLHHSFMHVVPESALSHPERRRSMLVMDTDVRSPEFKAWERKNISSLTDISEDDSQGELATRRKELGLAKVPFIAQYVKERLKNKNESILLFVWHREVARKLAEALSAYRPGLVMGGTDGGEREVIFRGFQAAHRKIIIGNIQAMGRGYNLQRADRVIFGEYSWTDELNKQCEKRASRKGSDKDFVRCEYIVAPRSMDKRMLKIIFTKEQRVKRMIG